MRSQRTIVPLLTYLGSLIDLARSCRSFFSPLTYLVGHLFLNRHLNRGLRGHSLFYWPTWGLGGHLLLPWLTWGLGGTFSLGSFPSPPRPYSGITLSLLIPAYRESICKSIIIIRKYSPNSTNVNKGFYELLNWRK